MIAGLGHYTLLEYENVKNIHEHISRESTQEASEPSEPSSQEQWVDDDKDYWDDYHSPIADGWRDGCWGIGK